MLTKEIWHTIHKIYGGVKGHSYDLMALDSNCMKSNDVSILKHFTPFPTPQTNGVNVFAQEILNGERTVMRLPLLTWLYRCYGL